MNGMETRTIPKYLEGEPLPEGYFDEPDPYKDHPTCNMNLRALGEYVRMSGKKNGWELTKKEVSMFEPSFSYEVAVDEV